MKRMLPLTGAVIVALILGPGQAGAEGPAEIYPEQRADGQVYTVGRWAGGSYATAVGEYPEARPDGSQVYVYTWDNGTQSVLLREYVEADADGAAWVVRAWGDGSYTRVQAPAVAAAQPRPAEAPPRTAPPAPPPPLKAAALDPAVRQATWWSTVSLVSETPDGGYSQGTGIVVRTSAEGFDLLTAHHVVASRRPRQPILVGPFGGWTETAEVLATAPRADLALLRVPSQVRIYGAVPLGDSDAVAVGESVYLFSYPGSGQGGLIMSDGVILARVPMRGGRGVYLATNAVASPGSSGGVAVNARGELIGIVSAVISDRQELRRLGYPEVGQMTLLVPSNEAAALLERAASGT